MNDDDVCVIDNIDNVLRAAGPEGSLTVVENLVSRSGAVIMSSTTHCPHLRQLSQRADKVLVLSLAKEESSLAWGGRGICPPGRGLHRVTTLPRVLRLGFRRCLARYCGGINCGGNRPVRLFSAGGR